MKLTPVQRRQRLEEMIKSDPDCGQLWKEYMDARQRFTKMMERKPRKMRDRLWELPGVGYFLYHRVLMMVCDNMRFADETE